MPRSDHCRDQYSPTKSRQQFRADLYYRLKMVSFHVPPLRTSDIPILIIFLMSTGDDSTGLTGSITGRRQGLQTYSWPRMSASCNCSEQAAAISPSGTSRLLKSSLGAAGWRR